MKDFVSENLGINEKGHLEISGCDCLDLAKEFKTPLYAMDENAIRKNCKIYVDAINENYDGNGIILYASKALSTLAIYKIAAQEGLGADVVSAGELYTALKAGFDPAKIYFHGNNKSEDEIRFGLENRIKRFVADNENEINMISKISQEMGITSEIALRIKPGIEAHTHEAILTGKIDSKFGVAIEGGEAIGIISRSKNLPGIKVVGIHCHIGSQIFEEEAFIKAAEVMMGFMLQCKNELGITLTELNLGGGYGIRYTTSDTPVKFDAYIKAIAGKIKSICYDENFPVPFICMEPGRSIVATAGITLYTVGTVKEVKGYRTYVTVDGGMGDSPRYALYQAKMDAVIADRPDAKTVKPVTIAGKYCESGDLIQENIPMPEVVPGEILAVMSTGAYNYSMASNYNRNPRPAMVLCKDSKARLIVAREKLEDLVKNDIIPEDL